jgi:aspartyl-tRNA synthetase
LAIFLFSGPAYKIKERMPAMDQITKNQYRTCSCGELRENNIGETVRAAGWVQSIRDHGGIQFLDLRDQYGVLQVVFRDQELLRGITKESVISVEGPVVLRDPETVNEKIPTGRVEVRADRLTLLGPCTRSLPFEPAASRQTREDTRLRFRYLDLRNPRMHQNMVLRSQVISWLRRRMEELGFLELQTPILTASSPEGARDYLIPSRKHRGEFYALPQAPQIFKQLLMTAGFDRYFQVAPCFRDEDARADRTPGEFYQLDFEMAFATQEDVLAVAEEVVGGLFRRFAQKPVAQGPFPRISYAQAMLRYGTDKPDLRNPLKIQELSDLFAESAFAPFRGRTVRGIAVPGAAGRPRSFFTQMEEYALSIGMKGLGYLKVTEEGPWQGPIDKFLTPQQREELRRRCSLTPGDVLYFIADGPQEAPRLAGQIRTRLGEVLGLCREGFSFCFVTDFPMYERDELEQLVFTHNPFSMPQGGLEALNGPDPESVLAWQYDLVCNGVELASGAVRSHHLPTLLRGFQLAGYTEKTVLEKFPALCNALACGAPPHAGMAPGIDRMVMLLAEEGSIREVIPFPMNASAQDLMMGAPAPVTQHQLNEVHIQIR